MTDQGGGGLAGRRVLVVGIGVSGVGAARALLAAGARVRVVDAADGDRQRAAAGELRRLGAEVGLGGLPPTPGDADLVVTSPGLPPATPLFAAAAAKRVPVWGEVELAWRWRGDTRWLAVTGTNGKTTTTEMLAAILAAAGRHSAAAGNIGTPIVEATTTAPPYEVLAVELSSFQLHYTDTLAPAAAAVLNVAPDHLDWHGSEQAYAADKARIWADETTVAIGNLDDPVSRRLLAEAPGRRVGFGLGAGGLGAGGLSAGGLGAGGRGAGGDAKPEVTVEAGRLVDHAFGGGDLVAVAELGARGPHNVANALAAAALARADGVPPEVVGSALRDFRPGVHRNAEVARVGGVVYVDDSKATNPHAAAASLAAYRSVVWIAGGLNKGLSFDGLVAGAARQLRAVVLIGRCADEIAHSLARHAPEVPVERAAGMDDAVVAAAGLARPGDTVLLAPAAASMDMFRDYAERGEVFAAAARRLPGGM